ncbi:MAG TPA: hypothetical protein VMV45_07165 [Casimicrobiaceae bacterium]|nr:hypothetical protein [Casimicrobiaceae bacterium]
MSKYPVARNDKHLAPRSEDDAGEPTIADSSSWLSFRYTYTEISARRGTAHVKRRETRLENGIMSSETIEGTLDGAAFDALARNVRDQIARQTQLLMNPLLWFLPAPRKRDND